MKSEKEIGRALIKERRSTFAFKADEVDLDIIKEIFTYASYAPTHYMKEAWRVKLYKGAGKKKLVDAIIKSYQKSGLLGTDGSEKTVRSIRSIEDFLLKIPYHALIYFEKETDPVHNEEAYSSVAAFIQNAQLAAWTYDVGMLWTITPYMHDIDFIKEIGLNPHTEKIAAVMQIGYPEKMGKFKERTAVEQFMEIIETTEKNL